MSSVDNSVWRFALLLCDGSEWSSPNPGSSKQPQDVVDSEWPVDSLPMLRLNVLVLVTKCLCKVKWKRTCKWKQVMFSFFNIDSFRLRAKKAMPQWTYPQIRVPLSDMITIPVQPFFPASVLPINRLPNKTYWFEFKVLSLHWQFFQAQEFFLGIFSWDCGNFF